MMDKVTVLHARQTFGGAGYAPVGKYIHADGTKNAHPNTKFWEVFEHDVADLKDMYNLLQEALKIGCSILVRGKFKGGDHLSCQRTLENFGACPRHWVMLDIDNLKAPHGLNPISEGAIEHAISQIPKEFHDADCIAHFSSSAGLSEHNIKLHLFFWLEKPQSDELLKKWAKTTGGLVDPALFNAVQPHYVTDPTFEDPSQDPFRSNSRLSYIKKKRGSVPVSFLDGFKIPTPSKSNKEGVGILNHPRHGPAELRSTTGKLTDGREEHLLKIRFRLMNRGYEDFDQFVGDVWREFCLDCEQGPTKDSDTTWSFEDVQMKCEQDRNKLPSFVGSKVEPERNHLPREEAKSQMNATLQGFFSDPHNLLIRAEAGLGKSSAAQSILAAWPNITGKCIEVYVPTKKLAHEWAKGFMKENTKLDVRVIEGRSEENCLKWTLVDPVGELGLGVSHLMCHNHNKCCEHWKKCAWSKQNADAKPAIRILTHSHLKLPRPDNQPTPDFVVIDEGFMNEQIVSDTINLDRLESRRGYKLSLADKTFLAPSVGSSEDTLITRDDLDALIRVGGHVVEALQNHMPLLSHLRSNDVCPTLLRRCAKTIGAFTMRPYISPSDSTARQKSALSAAKSNQVGELRKLRALYEVLAAELETKRPRSRVVNLRDETVEIRYRRNLPRLDGIPALVLDADGEVEILRKSIPDIIAEQFPVRYNATVWQVSDKSFSKSSLSLSNLRDDRDCSDDVRSFLNNLPEPHSTLVVTYKAFQKFLTGTGDDFSKMPNGMTVGHFGNIRGTDDFNKFETVVIVGRHMPPRELTGILAGALCHDSEEDTPSEFEAAVYRTKITSETNQAAARLRMIWIDNPKTVYLLSNEKVTFAVDHLVTWTQLRDNKHRPTQLLQRFPVVPLDPEWLAKNAPNLFDTKTAAKKWIENNFPKGTEGGLFRLAGKRGPHKRFIMHDETLNPEWELEKMVGPLSAYDGPTRGFWINDHIWRQAYNEPKCRALYQTGVFGAPQHPKPK
jgi:hypothetical protein